MEELIDDILDKIFNELRDEYGMDDSREGHLTKVHNKKWVVVTRDSSFLTPRSKILVNRYYDLMPKELIEEALIKEKEQDKEIKEFVEFIKEK